MQQETLNLVIGALIALLSSIFTSFLNYKFQKNNTITQREFFLQDAYTQSKSQIIINRADEVEKLINTYIMWYSELHSLLMSIQISDEELRTSIQKLHEEFWKLPYAPHIMILVSSLDKNLGTATKELLDKLLEINLMLLLYVHANSSKQHPTEIIGEKIELPDIFFPLVISGLDKIRIDSKKPKAT